MDMKVTPVVIEVLMRAHYIVDYTPDTLQESSIIAFLLAEGVVHLISATGHCCYTTTLKGQAWVRAICHTPIPEVKMVFIDPRTMEEV